MPSLLGSDANCENNSNDIRQEIARFESVHPSIYAMYDKIESFSDRHEAEAFRRLVASIEDAFVNSQEWTLGYPVPQIKLGLLGSVHSGKSALVHRYLTGTYLKDESPEGGRFKKEVFLGRQSCLLLIRDEGGPPDEQFSRWIDGAVFVFSLDSEDSFRVVMEYFDRLDSFRDTSQLPIILVGTEDSTSESNPRTIDDSQARSLANSLNKCPYFETCATYGGNVERVFQDACIKIVNSRSDLADLLSTSAPSYNITQQVPLVQPRSAYPPQQNFPLQQTPSVNTYRDRMRPPASQVQQQLPVNNESNATACMTNMSNNMHCLHSSSNTTRVGGYIQRLPPTTNTNISNNGHQTGNNSLNDTGSALVRRSDLHNNLGFEPDFNEESRTEEKDSITPSSTPTEGRKTRPKSNIFRKGEDPRDKDKKNVDGIGSGRSIPLKQGYMYKRTMKPLNKDWKTKKYVALTEDSRLIYHPNFQDYVQNCHGKEIDLSRVTVKIPGLAFRNAGGQTSMNGPGRTQPSDINTVDKLSGSLENTNGNMEQGQTSNDSINSGNIGAQQTGGKDASKKRYRRVKSSQKTGATDGYESEGYEFQLISMDRQWHFEAVSMEDRDEWVTQIDRAILSRLQLLESSSKSQSSANAGRSGGSISGGGQNWGHGTSGSDPGGVKSSNGGSGNSALTAGQEKSDNSSGGVDEAMAKILRSVSGNDICADCGALDPEWASLNLGEMVCIGCSGVHRQLGTHISRIRSLFLDDWTQEAVAVMRAIGNTLANSVWEAAVPVQAGNRRKPEVSSSREEKEAWIRAKYEHREFLPPLPYPEAPLQQQLIDAIARQDTRQVILCLARATPDTVNAAYSRHDPRAAIHIAATLGNIVYLQLLLWYNGNPGVVDAEGRNAFYYAHCSLHKECANFLHRSGCPRQPIPSVVPPPLTTSGQQPTPHQLQQRQSAAGASKSIAPTGLVPVNPMATPKHLQQHPMLPLPPGSSYRVQTSMQSQLPPGNMISGVAQLTPGYSNMYLHNMMPVSSQSGMHGTMGGVGNMMPPHMTSASSSVTAAAGATLPRRRGPLHSSNQMQPAFLSGPHPVYNNVALLQQQQQQQQSLSGQQQQQTMNTVGRPNPNYILGVSDSILNRPLPLGVPPISAAPPIVSPLTAAGGPNQKAGGLAGAGEIGV